MKVIILAAGYGTRLKAIAENTPKPLLAINHRPLINYILDRIKDLPDLEEVLVVTNNKFAAHFQQWSEDVNFTYPIDIVNDKTNSPEDRLGSIGDIEYVIRTRNLDGDVLVVGGDNLFDYNLDQYIMFARTHPEAVTIGVYDIHDLEEAKLYGVVGVDDAGKVTSFQEKPQDPKSTLISMCFYYLPRQTLKLVGAYLAEVGKSDRAGDYIRWLQEKHEVYGFNFVGKWYDIGSVEAYREAQKKFLNES